MGILIICVGGSTELEIFFLGLIHKSGGIV